MLKKFSIAAVAAAVSLVASGNSYKVNVIDDSTVDGKQLKAGHYKLDLEGNTATLKQGKDVVTVAAHAEKAAMKYQETTIQYVNNQIHEIHLGGTTTKVVFGAADSTANAGGGTN